MKKEERYFMASVKIGPKGQIVIPKEVREMFDVGPGDTLVLLADRKKGVALQRVEKLSPLLRGTFDELAADSPEEEME